MPSTDSPVLSESTVRKMAAYVFGHPPSDQEAAWMRIACEIAHSGSVVLHGEIGVIIVEGLPSRLKVLSTSNIRR